MLKNRNLSPHLHCLPEAPPGTNSPRAAEDTLPPPRTWGPRTRPSSPGRARHLPSARWPNRDPNTSQGHCARTRTTHAAPRRLAWSGTWEPRAREKAPRGLQAFVPGHCRWRAGRPEAVSQEEADGPLGGELRCVLCLLQREDFPGAALGASQGPVQAVVWGVLPCPSHLPETKCSERPQAPADGVRHRHGRRTPPRIPSEGSCRGSSRGPPPAGGTSSELAGGVAHHLGARGPGRSAAEHGHGASVSDPHTGPRNHHTPERPRLSRWCAGRGRGPLTLTVGVELRLQPESSPQGGHFRPSTSEKGQVPSPDLRGPCRLWRTTTCK